MKVKSDTNALDLLGVLIYQVLKNWVLFVILFKFVLSAKIRQVTPTLLTEGNPGTMFLNMK